PCTRPGSSQTRLPRCAERSRYRIAADRFVRTGPDGRACSAVPSDAPPGSGWRMDAAALGVRRTPGQSAVASTGARAVAAAACVTALVLAVVAGAYAHGGSDGSDHPAVVAPPGYAPAAFTAPPAGTYTLPVLGAAADGTVLDELGRTRRLHELFDGRLVLLSF